MKGHSMRHLFLGCSLLVASVAAVALGGCGSSSDAISTADDEGRLITGTIDATSGAALTVKSLGASASCLGEICAVRATNADGSEVQGEVLPALNQWRIRVRAGNWMFGFEDGNGQRLGTLAMNGILAMTIEEGDDVDLGPMRLRDRLMIMDQDREGLGTRGIHSFVGAAGDRDYDGIPSEFDPDEDAASYDPAVFDLLLLRPYDGQPHVAPCRPVKFVFNQALDDATVTSDAILVTLEDGTPVAGTFAIWEDDAYNEYEVKFLPEGGFPMGATVLVTVLSGEDGVKSADGAALPADVSTAFTVRDWGSTSDTCHDPDGELQQLRIQERQRVQDGSGSGDGQQQGQ
jgi:Bacterial Ig-like domain